jgi:hypothetical protein
VPDTTLQPVITLLINLFKSWVSDWNVSFIEFSQSQPIDSAFALSQDLECRSLLKALNDSQNPESWRSELNLIKLLGAYLGA